MTEQLIWLVIGTGILISIFLLRFSYKTWQKIQRIEVAKNAYQQKVAEKQQDAINSIKVLAQCMIDKQVELSEGCIRVKILLDHVAPKLHEDKSFSIFIKMYDALEHMPTHEARKQADKRLVFKLDQERFKLEEDNQQAILAASKALLAYAF